MLDVSRDKVPTMATLYALVDRLAEWKVNQLELYAEHTFAYPDHEVVWRDASPLTAAEIRALDAYCAARHVALVPNQNCLGHMNRWLLHDAYRALAMDPEGYAMMGMRRPPSTIEPTDPASLALVRGLLAELLAQLLGLPVRARRARRAVGAASRAVRRLPRLGARRCGRCPELDGRELLVWGDILAPHPDRLGELPDGVTVCEWGYDAGHPWDAAPHGVRRRRRPALGRAGHVGWLTILGRTTNMRADIAEAVDAGSGPRRRRPAEHRLGRQRPPPVPAGQRSRARVRRGDELVRGDQPRPRPRRRARARTATTTRPASSARSSSRSATCTDGSRRRSGTWRPLVLPLYFPQLDLGRGPLQGARADEYDAVDADLDALEARLARSGARRPDADLLVAELRNAIGARPRAHRRRPRRASRSAARSRIGRCARTRRPRRPRCGR